MKNLQLYNIDKATIIRFTKRGMICTELVHVIPICTKYDKISA